MIREDTVWLGFVLELSVIGEDTVWLGFVLELCEVMRRLSVERVQLFGSTVWFNH